MSDCQNMEHNEAHCYHTDLPFEDWCKPCLVWATDFLGELLLGIDVLPLPHRYQIEKWIGD